MTDRPDGTRVVDVEPDWIMPALPRRVVGKRGHVETSTSTQSWSEYDTAARDLATCGVDLARTADGWRLTVDDTTILFPPEGRAMPEALRGLLFGVRGGAALRVSRRVRRERVSHTVRDRDGAVRGTIDDVHDRVTAAGAAATLTVHRRVEINGWAGPFVETVTALLPPCPAVEPGGPTPAATVGDVVLAHVREQRRAILLGDMALRRGEPAIHTSRIAIRRLRSVLRVVQAADVQRATAMDDELRWLAGLLGEVRDREVLREHLRVTVDEILESADVAHASIAAAVEVLDAALVDEHHAAQAALSRAMTGRRYLALLGTLREWAEQPPFTDAAARPARRMDKDVAKAERRLGARLARAGGDVEQLHRARKAAKRVRYAADLADGAVARSAARERERHRVTKRAKGLQTTLGDHQDAVVAAQFVERVGLGASGPAAFGCGVIWTAELDRARRALP